MGIRDVFAQDVADELVRARAKHPKPMHSKHEGYAVLLEEVREVEDEVFDRIRDCGDGLSDRRKLLRDELVQVAAMAQRMAEDLNL